VSGNGSSTRPRREADRPPRPDRRAAVGDIGSNRTHRGTQRPQLIAWNDLKLTEDEKEKDRSAVRAIPTLLAAVGFTLITP